MEKKRVLIVTQAMKPYLDDADIAQIARELPEYVQEQGMEIRVLMPRFGSINERRNRLHEVVRLSGLNISIADDDYPLIIKVASLPGARMQVYFLDNDDLFSRKGVFHDTKNKFFKDNGDRMIFFCKGVLDTVKKFGWAPDIIHCHGWMTSLIPLYLKTHYSKEHIFTKSKVVYSIYGEAFEDTLENEFSEKITNNNSIDQKELDELKEGNYVTLNVSAMKHADAIVQGVKKIDKKLTSHLNTKKPIVDFNNGEDYLEAYFELYKQLLNEK